MEVFWIVEAAVHMAVVLNLNYVKEIGQRKRTRTHAVKYYMFSLNVEGDIDVFSLPEKGRFHYP